MSIGSSRNPTISQCDIALDADHDLNKQGVKDNGFMTIFVLFGGQFASLENHERILALSNKPSLVDNQKIDAI
jgi:hypothetical protein